MRVLVTRPQAEAARTAERLAARGHAAVVAPVLSIERTKDVPPPGPFEALVVTSANAAPALTELEGRALPVFAVGHRTAAAAAATGFADIRTSGSDAAALAALIVQDMRPGARLLLVAGRERKPEPDASLRAAGFQVETWIVYAARGADRLPDAARRALEDAQLDAALHYSRRSAAILLDLVGAAGLMRPFLTLDHLCLSPDAAAPLREAGARRIIPAERPDEEALLAKINRGGPHRSGRRNQRPGAKDGTKSPAPVSLSSPPSSSPPEETAVTETPPDTSDPRPRRTGPYREPPTLDLKATVVPDEPARNGDPAKGAGTSQAETGSPRSEATSAGPAGGETGSGPTSGTAPQTTSDALGKTPGAALQASSAAPPDAARRTRTRVYPAAEAPVTTTPSAASAEPKAAPEDRVVTEAAEARTEAAPVIEPAPAPPSARPETRRGLGAGALLGTGLLGGLVGAGLAVLGQTYWGASRNQSDPRFEQLEQRLGSVPSREAVGNLERRLSALDAEQKSLNERLRAAQQSPGGGQTPAPSAPVERAPDLTPALSALTERFSLLEADVRGLAPLRDQVQANLEATRSLDQRLSDLQGQVRTTIDAAVRGLDQRLTAALGQTRDQLRDQIQANAEATRTLERRFADQDQRLTAQDQRLAALTKRIGDRDPAELATTALRITLADRLGGALRTSTPLGPTLDALRRLNADPQALATLEPYAAQGAPSAAALAQAFKPLGDRIVAESRPASSNASWSDRLLRMADQVVTVRAANDTGVADAPSLVARIQNALANNALRDAAAAWDALPEPARRSSEEWGRRLKQRLAAEEAVQKISDRALTALDASTR